MIRLYLALGACAIMGVSCAGLGIHAAGLKSDLNAANAKIVTLQSDLNTARDNVATMRGAVDAQNAAVDALGEVAASMQANAIKAVSEAVRGRVGAEQRAADVLATQADGDLCGAADRVLGARQ